MKKNIEDIYPLSPMQQGMLFHTLYAPASQIYITQIGCLLEGEVSVPDFERAWQQVVRRNPILRTAFVWERLAEPLQVVFRDAELVWVYEDWQEYSASDQQERLDAFMMANQERGVELSRPPLIRPTLIKLARNKHYLILCHHHLLMDGWSLPLILSEGFSCYFAYCLGTTPELPLRRPYRNYIDWLSKRDLRDAETFWRKYLAGFTVPTLLGLESAPRMPANELTETYEDITTTLPVETSKGLQALAREYKLTFGVLLQAAWALLLHYYSGEQDVLFGLATAGRSADLPGITSMIGLFVNTVPVRVRIEPDMPLVTWVYELHRNLAQLLEYEHSPLVQVLGWSQVARGTPLFESLLIFDNYPVDAFISDNETTLRVQFLRSVEHTNFPLALRARPGTNGEVSLSLSYAKSRFEEEMVERIFEHLFHLLAAFMTRPTQRLRDLSILGEQERKLLLHSWNATEVSGYLAGLPSLQKEFENRVRQMPDARAIECAGVSLTYERLNQRANQLAHYLLKRGVGCETRVGVCLERGIDLFVCLLAILKAGGTYIPLDINIPTERFDFMVQDAQLSLLVSKQHLKKAFTSLVPVIFLDTAWSDIAQQANQNLVQPVAPENAAYIIYTSGSTGQPKGVIGTHGATLNRLRWMWQAYPFRDQEVCCQKIALTFVDSIWELFGPLLQGCPVVVIEDEVAKDPIRLIASLERHKVTRLVLVPSLLRLLLNACTDPGTQLSALQVWVCSGEELPMTLWQQFRERMPQALLVNLYGSSEVAADAICCELNALEAGYRVPIGRPIANTQSYVLDAHWQPVPIGVPGDLYIGGMGLARGYCSCPDLTAEHFIPHPFSKQPGMRLYSTGDRARYRPDGQLEFLGRSDRQIKLHGIRIELGEIENVLGECSHVGQCAAMLREDQPGEKRLICYIRPVEEATPPSVSALRDYLRNRLPVYMQPAAFVFLANFPLTSGGKIDYLSLPVPDHCRPSLGEDFVSARTPEEQLLTQIWKEILQLDQIGVKDSFFDLGGHSLLMIQLYTRIREHFKRDILLFDMFKYPTIASLAEYLVEEKSVASEVAALKLANARGRQRAASLQHQREFRARRRDNQREKEEEKYG